MLLNIIISTPMYVTFFWAIVLLVSGRKANRPKFFLGIFMISAFLLYLSHSVFFHKNYGAYLFFDSVYIFASLSVYPLYFWYIKLLTVETEIKWYNMRLLLPAIIFSISTGVIYFLMSENERTGYVMGFLFKENVDISQTILMNIQKYLFYLNRLAFTFQVVFFLYHGRKLVIHYNDQVANFYSNLESRTIVWVNLLFYSFFVTSIMSIVFNIIGRALFSQSVFLLLIPSLIFSVLLFIIGFQGNMQNYSVIDIVLDELTETEHKLSIKNYNKNQLKEKFIQLFETEKIYKQPDLKITQISVYLNTNRTYISNLINNEFHCTFSDFVNRYRLREAKINLSDESFKNFSLEYISENAGFGSLSSFIRVFKENEGVTPGTFREKRILNKNQK